MTAIDHNGLTPRLNELIEREVNRIHGQRHDTDPSIIRRDLRQMVSTLTLDPDGDEEDGISLLEGRLSPVAADV